MQIKSQKMVEIEQKELEMVVARDTKNVRKNSDTINDNKTQQL